MSPERSFGLQWRLAIIFLVVGAGSSLTALAVYWMGTNLNYPVAASIGLGLCAGALVGLTGAVIGSIITRSFKLRLWEAGQMAGRIARGDYRTRLKIGPDDEVGWLEEQLNQMAGQLETAVSSLRELAEQNRRLGEEAGRGAALEERMRLARDLHDTVNQQLFVLAMRAAALKRRLEQTGVETALLEQELNDLEELARKAHSQIRELILEIRPVTLEKEGLGAALKEYLKNLAERENWEVTVNIDLSIRTGGHIGESLFRITQEALNNISKHASAGLVAVSLTKEDQNIRLRVADNGAGFDPKSALRPTSVGLSGIRERVAAIGGRFAIDSSPGRGTDLTVLVPLNNEGGGER